MRFFLVFLYKLRWIIGDCPLSITPLSIHESDYGQSTQNDQVVLLKAVRSLLGIGLCIFTQNLFDL